MGGGCSFPIRAASREEAVQILQKCLGRFNMELSMEFPKTVPMANMAGASEALGADLSTQPGVPGSLDDVLIERIDTLMTTLGGGGLADDVKAKTIKNWTELEFAPQNLAKIVHELELFASGAKTVPPPTQSKKK